jgi:hypothetical protein
MKEVQEKVLVVLPTIQTLEKKPFLRKGHLVSSSGTK